MKLFNSTLRAGKALLRMTPLRKISEKRLAEAAKHDELMHKLEQRSHGICEVCNKAKAVEPHHVLRQEKYPEHKFNPDICLHVCRHCHEWFHNRGYVALYWVEDNKPIIYNEYKRLKREADRHGN